MIDIESVKQQNPLRNVVEKFTGQQVTRRNIHCPFHEDNNPSMHVYDDGKFKCFSCGRHGDVIDFVGYFLFGDSYSPDTHFADVVDRLGALDIRPLPPRTTRPKPEKPKLAIDLELCMEWHDGMTAEQRAYWNGRGLEDKTIDRFFLGFDGQRYTIPLLYRLQCFGVKRRITPEHQAIKKEEIAAAIEILRAEHPDWTDEQIRKAAPAMPPKYVTREGSRAGLFNADTLWTASACIICEGEIDAMLLTQFGYHAVTSTAGAGSWKPEWARFFTHVRDIYILFDNDKAGKEGAAKVHATLRRAHIVSLPEGIKDVGELWAAGYAANWLSENVG